MVVGDKHFFIRDKMVTVGSAPITIDSKVICLRHNQGIIKPAPISIGDDVLIMPTSSGKVTMRSIIIPIDETQYWYDSEFQNGDTKYYSSEFSDGTYKLTVDGWYTVWDDYDSRLICDESYSGNPKFISCCQDSLKLIINGTEYGIGTICTTRDLPNLTGHGTIVIPSGATVGIKLIDNPYYDDHGSTTFKIEGPI